ncbi:MAG: DNA mismatch repair protein MutS [Firmicutes bacterium]|nr:DNA mismatch repair protein MutS [Bacillota bacterium]
MTPMMLQYLEIKDKYKDYLLFYRIGDFYEMFFDDAKIASKELDLVLTGRDCGESERAPMCGVPFHSCDPYIGKLVGRGYKIAICEQLEDPATAEGLVKRDVIRVITPGTVVDNGLLNESVNNYLCTMFVERDSISLAFCDISGTAISTTLVSPADSTALFQEAINEIVLFNPSELITNTDSAGMGSIYEYLRNHTGCVIDASREDLFADKMLDLIFEQFGKNAADFGIEQKGGEARCTAAMLYYLKETQKTTLSGICAITPYRDDNFLQIDASSRRNLELCETLRQKEKRGSLLWVLDKTCSALGARLLRRFIEQPLTNCRAIMRRQSAVSEFAEKLMLRDELRETLCEVTDIERLTSKLLYGNPSARDLVSIANTFKILPNLKNVLSSCSGEELEEMAEKFENRLYNPLYSLGKYIERAINDDPPFSLREGNLIKSGFSDEIDQLRQLVNESRDYLAQIENREKELTGIKGLKIGYNKVFGYYLEVTNSYKPLVPDRYIRKQTLTGCERYITQELKDMEGRILGAKEKSTALEYEVFMQVVDKVRDHAPLISELADIIARLDVYSDLAYVAEQNGYSRPEVDYSDKLILKDSRHPVVELLSRDSFFVPNDAELDCESNRMAIITGPNMAGKSTYMRQIALIVVMAQIGSFVPAKSARIGIVDKIFTRVGASDDLASGQSTFMLEMSEVAYILKNATRSSLIIYDEIGRGTSTYDGMSIARAVVEYTAGKKIGAKTLFATHYHELSELENTIEGVKNYNIAAKKRDDSITFLRKIVPGAADDSYGIEVAKLAGVPNEVIKTAKKTLAELESGNIHIENKNSIQPKNEITVFDTAANEITDELKSINVNTLTPIEALSKLFELSNKAKQN